MKVDSLCSSWLLNIRHKTTGLQPMTAENEELSSSKVLCVTPKHSSQVRILQISYIFYNLLSQQ